MTNETIHTNETPSLEEAVAMLSSLETPVCAVEPPKTEGRRLRRKIALASEIEPKPVEFLWNPYLPIGEVTMMMAAGGTGKTFALCGIAAALSRGRRPLNELDTFPPAYTLFISAEDRNSVLRERLESSGADLKYVHMIDDAASVGINLSEDSGMELCDLIRATKAKLVVLDPLHAFIGGIDLNRVNVVRPVMHALAAVAKKCECAIVIVSHVSKRQSDGNANNLAIGSVDLVNASRSVLRVTGDETGANPARRVIVHTKSNYAAYGESVAFELTEDGMRWLGFSQLNRELLEGASLSRCTLPEYVSQRTRIEASDDALIAGFVALCHAQTEPRTFYANRTLRDRFPEHFASGNLKPTLSRLRDSLYQHGVTVEFGQITDNRIHTTCRGVFLSQKNAFLDTV